MISIKYRITDEVQDQIQHTSDDEFSELTDSEGQFKLTICSNSIGYIDSDISLSEELLIHWFVLLNQVVNKLHFADYVALAMQ